MSEDKSEDPTVSEGPPTPADVAEQVPALDDGKTFEAYGYTVAIYPAGGIVITRKQ